MLIEQVEDINGLAFKTRGDGVIAQVVIAPQHHLVGIPLQVVGLAAVILAQVDVHAVSGTNLHLTKIGTGHRLLQKIDVADRVPDLGGEILGPVRVPVQGIGRQFGAALIEVLVKFKFVQVAIRGREVEGIVVHIGEGQALGIRGVPVKFDQVFFIVEIEGLGHGSARFIAINVLGNPCDPIQLSLGDQHLIDGTRADRAAIIQVGAVILLVGAIEKQLVLDNGTAHFKAPAGLLIVLGLDAVALELVTAQGIRAVVEEHRTEQIVGAGLGHCVDVTGREATVNNAHGGHFHGYAGDGIVGKRHTLGGITVAVQAKTVV